MIMILPPPPLRRAAQARGLHVSIGKGMGCRVGLQGDVYILDQQTKVAILPTLNSSSRADSPVTN